MSTDILLENGFSEFCLNQQILSALDDLGYENATEIQKQSIPHIIQGRDVLGLAQTGSGKTAAFGLPILSKIQFNSKAPQALILAPTRELAIQVSDAIKSFAKHLRNVSILPVFGGQSYTIQIRALHRGVDIVVGTPGRIKDLITRNVLDLSDIKFMVLDEADEMLNMGFLEDVEWIMEHTPENRQTVLFSATMPPPIQKITKRHMKNPLDISVKSKTATASTIEQRCYITAQRRMPELLTNLLQAEMHDGVIIFTKTKSMTADIAEQLARSGFRCMALNGDMPQKNREDTIRQFRSGVFDIIVATDVAARGIDVDRVTHVVNYGLPQSTLAYIHRIGRTGRAGRTGIAITLVDHNEKYAIKKIERMTKQHISECPAPTFKDIERVRFERLKKKIDENISSADLQSLKTFIKTYCKETGHAELDVSAALAALIQGPMPKITADKPSRDHHAERGSSDRRDSKDGRRRERKFDDTERRDTRPKSFKDKSEKESKFGKARKSTSTFEADTRDTKDAKVKKKKYGKKEKVDSSSASMQRYTINIGSADGIKPNHIVGAIANETTINRKMIGQINIYDDHSIVELPKDLPTKQLLAISNAWFAGKQMKACKLN